MLDRPSIAVKKSVVMRVGALLAMMAILVLSSPAPNGVFAHPHDDGQAHDGVAADTDDHIHYAENGMGEVRDFDSTDPEGSGIEWNVRGVDAADFEISSAGVLTFMESPDYEDPTDRGLNLNEETEGGNPVFTDWRIRSQRQQLPDNGERHRDEGRGRCPPSGQEDRHRPHGDRRKRG